VAELFAEVTDATTQPGVGLPRDESRAEPRGKFAVDDPRAPDVVDLLGWHLAFTAATSPPEDCHALDVDGLCHPSVTLVSFRRGGELLAVGALKLLEAGHGELKSMHTAERARGEGIGRAMVDHLLALARREGLTRVSLETGTAQAFAPARALYAAAGFTACAPFGSYLPSPHSTFMTLQLR
jgi:putative acetyltransferase